MDLYFCLFNYLSGFSPFSISLQFVVVAPNNIDIEWRQKDEMAF